MLRRCGIDARYLGWLRRPQLWKAFAAHDALVMPSTTLEAMGLVAIEAQACGLPVVYQPVPGLREALGPSALATDFTSPQAAASDLDRLRTSRGLLPALEAAGREKRLLLCPADRLVCGLQRRAPRGIAPSAAAPTPAARPTRNRTPAGGPTGQTPSQRSRCRGR
jgi:hypothetical protein